MGEGGPKLRSPVPTLPTRRGRQGQACEAITHASTRFPPPAGEGRLRGSLTTCPGCPTGRGTSGDSLLTGRKPALTDSTRSLCESR